MPIIHYKGKKIHCKPGENLRKVLLASDCAPYNGMSRFVNCFGLGSCGTCAVWIKGIVNQKTFMERWRLRFPPHKGKDGIRLACQVRVWGDLEIIKGEGFWGQKINVEDPKINESHRQT